MGKKAMKTEPPMSLNAAVWEVLFVLVMLRDNHGSILDLILKELSEEPEKDRQYLNEAIEILEKFHYGNNAVIVLGERDKADIHIVHVKEEKEGT